MNREPWEPICKFGDTPEQVRTALQEAQAASLVAWCAEQRAAGLPLSIVLALAAFQERLAADALDAMVERVLRDMAVSAGAERIH